MMQHDDVSPLDGHLRDLASSLSGQGWERRLPDEWTPAQRAEQQRVAVASRDNPEAFSVLEDWLTWYFHEPITEHYDETGAVTCIRHNVTVVWTRGADDQPPSNALVTRRGDNVTVRRYLGVDVDAV
jgi:hypothetical protein